MTPDPLHIPDSFANSKIQKIWGKETREPSKTDVSHSKSSSQGLKWPKDCDKETEPNFVPKPKTKSSIILPNKPLII